MASKLLYPILFQVLITLNFCIALQGQPKKPASKSNLHVLKINCDLPANIYLDGVFKGQTDGKLPLQISLPKGNFTVRAASKDSPGKFKEQQVKISKLGTESYQYLTLSPLFNEDQKKRGKLKASASEAEPKIESLQKIK
jgi:hypothetical protein